jgi:hypothetical protein
MRKVENSCGRSCTAGSSSIDTRPRPSGADAQQVGGLELGQPEEDVGTLVGKGDQLAQDDPGRRRRQPTEVLEVGLALVAREVLDDRAQVLEVVEPQALGVGVVEDQAETRLLSLVEPQHLGQQRRAEGGDRGADRDALALAAEGVELRRVCRADPLLADVGGARGDSVVAHARAWPCRTGRP